MFSHGFCFLTSSKKDGEKKQSPSCLKYTTAYISLAYTKSHCHIFCKGG